MIRIIYIFDNLRTNGIQRSRSPETTHQTIQRPENWEKPCYNCYENKLMYDIKYEVLRIRMILAYMILRIYYIKKLSLIYNLKILFTHKYI